jgi:hypothetical protein
MPIPHFAHCRWCDCVERTDQMRQIQTRRYACWGCWLDRNGLVGITDEQLAVLPQRLLRERGLLDQAFARLNRRFGPS